MLHFRSTTKENIQTVVKIDEYASQAWLFKSYSSSAIPSQTTHIATVSLASSPIKWETVLILNFRIRRDPSADKL
jgi:hypothetical protein